MVECSEFTCRAHWTRQADLAGLVMSFGALGLWFGVVVSSVEAIVEQWRLPLAGSAVESGIDQDAQCW